MLEGISRLGVCGTREVSRFDFSAIGYPSTVRLNPSRKSDENDHQPACVDRSNQGTRAICCFKNANMRSRLSFVAKSFLPSNLPR